MRRFICLITLSIFLMTSIVGSAYASFVDSTHHRYVSSITALQNLGIIEGYPGNIFKPDQAITRAEMLKIVMLGAGQSISSESTICFIDVSIADRFHPYVCSARGSNIIQGYGDNTFQPHQAISLAEGLKIAIEALDITVSISSQGERFEPYIQIARQHKLFDDRQLRRVHTPITRAQMAHIIILLRPYSPRPLNNNISTPPITIPIIQNPSLSNGCNVTPPTTTPNQILVGDRVRGIITDVGSRYRSDTPIPLVVAFHGRTNPNTLVRSYYKIQQASAGNAIIVYPLGLPEAGPSRTRSDPGDKTSELRDIAFFDEIVAQMSELYCIDHNKIFVVGHSLGGWFSNTLACARGDVIRGVGSVGGSISRAECSTPTAAIIMHHPNDNLASFAGGEGARDALLSQNSCNIDQTIPYGPSGGNCVMYTQCDAGHPVVRCPHSESIENGRYYPHRRPSFAGQTIWDFWMSL